eukprot:jgi/Chrzof1/14934/Cz09g21100.t1
MAAALTCGRTLPILSRLRLPQWLNASCRVQAYVSTAERPPTTSTSSIFSSRAKIANNCVPWLRNSRTRSNFEKNFEVEEVYDGDVSCIQVAKCKLNDEKVVIKKFKKAKLMERPDLQHKMKLEWDIHSSLEHPNIIQAYLGMEFETSVGLFMEYAGDSDAFSYMSAKQRIALREQDAKQLIMDVLQALHYLHEQGVVHRDIKSENVFRTSSGQWKLGDFGSALRLGDEKALNRQPWKLEGTFSFAPPEYIMIWNGFTRRDLFNATSFKLDAWSVGALAYDVLVGRPPFALHDNITREAEQKAICQQDPHFPSGLSYSAVSFLKQCLEKDPQKRPSIKQLMHHQWFD